jgi:hypothetical protein
VNKTRLPQLNGAIPIVESGRIQTQQFRDYVNRLSAVASSTDKAMTVATGDVTLTEDDYYVIYNSGSYTVSLPSAVNISGREYKIKNMGTGEITVDPNGSQTIDGSLTVELGYRDGMQIVSDGSNWVIV